VDEKTMVQGKTVMAMTEEKRLLQLIRQIAREEFYAILDEDILPLLKDFIAVRLDASQTNSGDLLAESLVNALMGRASKAKEAANPTGQAHARWSWDPQKIAWSKAQGAKGIYERSEDINSPDFTNLLQDLSAHQGCLERDASFYWLFQNGSTIGRKKREEQK
jgi:hypothetical protein